MVGGILCWVSVFACMQRVMFGLANDRHGSHRRFTPKSHTIVELLSFKSLSSIHWHNSGNERSGNSCGIQVSFISIRPRLTVVNIALRCSKQIEHIISVQFCFICIVFWFNFQRNVNESVIWTVFLKCMRLIETSFDWKICKMTYVVLFHISAVSFDVHIRFFKSAKIIDANNPDNSLCRSTCPVDANACKLSTNRHIDNHFATRCGKFWDISTNNEQTHPTYRHSFPSFVSRNASYRF